MTDPHKGEIIEQHIDERRQLEMRLLERHVELAQAVNDLGRLYETFAELSQNDIDGLISTNEELQRRLAETEQRPHDTVVDASFPEVLQEIELLREENQRLIKVVADKDILLEELKQEAARPREPLDLDSFEAELYRDRQQIEADRQKLNDELQQVRTRMDELDEATREMEMEFSRERAELARERTRLERLREEVRAEVERLQRDGGVQKSLMSVQRLRETITQQKSSSHPSKR